MALLDVTVTVNGADYTGTTLGSVRIVRGREAIDIETRAGYCLAEIIDTTGAGYPFDVTDTVVVTLEDTTGPVAVFTGTLTDISTRLYAVRTGTRAIWQLLASGPLAIANRRQVLAGGTSVELDGDLAVLILRAGLRQTWEDFQGTTWAAVGPTVTWETVDPGFDESLIETPGEYEIRALDPQPEGYNALSLIAQVAASVGGSLFETGDGNVGYLSAYGRSERAQAGYTELPTEAVDAASLTAAKSAQDLINRLEVRYDGGVVELEDTTSISRYGVRASVLDTLLDNLTDAEERGDDLLFDRATPRYKAPQVRFALHTLPTGQVDTLIGVGPDTPVRLAGLPATLGNLFQRAFVEGIQYDLGPDRRFLTLFLSDHQLSLRSERWQDVDPTLAWQDVSATLEWAEARRVTV
jgi:hypothetical protein